MASQEESAVLQLVVDADLLVAVALLGVTLATVPARNATHGRSSDPAAPLNDVNERRRRAIEIIDNVVQSLFVAQAALAFDERQKCEDALRIALGASRRLMSDTFGESDSGLLLRSEPALGIETDQ